MNKQFTITRVVTKNFITDSFQGLRNLFGLRLRGYENMIKRGSDEVLAQMNSEHPKAKWWRMTINPLIGGSVMITVYGEE